MPELLGTVRRAFRVLDYLAVAEGPVAIKRIAADLGLNISSAYHLMHTLVADGYATRDRSGAFGLGPKAARMGEAYARSWPVEPRLRTLVQELAARTEEIAYLALLHGDRVVISEIVESRRHVRVHALHRGYWGDLHARALGKAVLAHLEPAVVRSHFEADPPRRLTPRTLVALADIEAELERVRRRGYAEDAEEFADGVCCIAAPFFGRHGVAGSLSVSVPSFRFRSVRATVREAVQSTAHAATEALGSQRSLQLG
ncbi:MAG: IclR family transcriptional regulator [Candidatus Eremiobacteraeota bacterium]|nr:IclR family transcriptional regulator [Candidatus Eremiobacteraeota bacterium]